MNGRVRVTFQRLFGQFGVLDNFYYTVSDPFRRIARAHRPFNVAFNLIWPLYHLHYPLPSSPLPLEILARPEIGLEYLYRDGHYHQLRFIWLFTIRDTPLRSLYRLCVSLCAQEHDEIRQESAYFWRHGDWPIRDIPDPKDPDPVRYAVLASLVEELVNAFNEKIENGLRRGMELYEIDHHALAQQENQPLETCPAWALQAPPLEQQVNFGRERSDSLLVWRRNILADANQLRNY